MKRDFTKSKLPPFSLLEEPQLAFSADDSCVDVNPLRGLEKFGPYSGKSFQRFTPKLRLATMGPESGWSRLKELVTTLRSFQQPKDRPNYVPNYRGFAEIFGIPIVAAQNPNAHVKWSDALDSIGSGGTPQAKLMQAFRTGLNRLADLREEFDVALVHLPDIWEAAFRGEGFDAHDSLKALAAEHGIPTQVINDRAFAFGFKASLAWRLSIALYVKAGGVPWKLANLPESPENTAYIGLAYALRKSEGKTHFVTCCSQVFDADGGGMQFVAFEAREPIAEDDEAPRNPFLSQPDMRSVLARSLNLYQQRNGGTLPRRLVIHKTTAFTPSEIAGVQDALEAVPEVECIEVSGDPSWRGIWLNRPTVKNRYSEPDQFPVPRGALLQLDGRSSLIWVAGNSPSASSGKDYYQGGKSIPRPIRITRWSGAGSFRVSAIEALALTKMDWNNDALYDPIPVTIRYSQRLARTIANVPSLPGTSYPYRLFM
jgi:hypothetical protein